MTRSSGTEVLALVAADGWRPDQVRDVTESLVGQVGQVQVITPSEPATAKPPAPNLPRGAEVAFVLVVTAPVMFARGAVRRLLRVRSEGTAVVRVLLPDGNPADVALWSRSWLQTEKVDLDLLADVGLDFDRVTMSAGGSRARIWVRGDDLGLVPLSAVPAKLAWWARIEGARLGVGTVAGALRARAGAVRRARALARQRRRVTG